MKKLFLFLILTISLNTTRINCNPKRTHFLTAVVVASAIYYFHNDIKKILKSTQNTAYYYRNQIILSFNLLCRDIKRELNAIRLPSFKIPWPTIIISKNDPETVIEAGEEATQNIFFNNLNAINAWGPGNVVIECNPNIEEKLTIIADKNILKVLEHYQSNTSPTLNFGPKDNVYFNRTPTINYIVYIKHLNKLSASGNLIITTNNILAPSEDLKINLSGKAKLDITIDNNCLKLDNSSGSNIILKGSTKTQNINLSGSSITNAHGFTTEKATIKTSGNSKVLLLKVTNELTCKSSGSSKIHYFGSPQLKISTSGSSSIQQMGY